jgi:Nuclease A inhibitor-like protein
MTNPSPRAENSEPLTQQMTAAVAGLNWLSETDAPFEIGCWTDISQQGLTVDQVISQAQLPPETSVEVISLDDFLDPVTQPQPWHGEEDAQIVEQFQGLRVLLEQTLTQIRVYRCGMGELDIYVVGQTPDLGWLVLHTTAVET